MRKLNEEDKEKIAEQVEYFRTEKLKFDAEVAKWDDTGNDIIVIAKHMCMIMMEMTDFTRCVDGEGCQFWGGSNALILALWFSQSGKLSFEECEMTHEGREMTVRNDKSINESTCTL